jgi:hypothetical protein
MGFALLLGHWWNRVAFTIVYEDLADLRSRLHHHRLNTTYTDPLNAKGVRPTRQPGH